MHSIEIINAINEVGTNASDTARSKAEYWIDKGVARACEKAIAIIEETIEEAESRPAGDEWRVEAILQGLQVDLRTLKSERIRQRLVASAWHRRADSK